MSRTFTGKLTIAQLAEAVAYEFVKDEDSEVFLPASKCHGPIEFLQKNRFRSGKITKRVIQDLEKVQFDEENMEWEAGEGYAGLESITGFNTLPNGLTYLGVTAGGDWEAPLFYIIYYDGQSLRGYIPEAGNHWNTDSKTAYGNDGDGEFDTDNIRKRFGVNSKEELGDMDPMVILDDITRRIQPAPGRFVTPKGMADIDAPKVDVEEKTSGDAKEWEQQQLTDALDEIKDEANLFVSEVERLRGMGYSPEALAEAEIIQNGRLQGIVDRFNTVIIRLQM